MKPLIDNFSSIAATYAQYRPESPDEIYTFLYSKLQHFDAAWDCGTGNGQVAIKLAQRFENVYATDISAEQLQIAPQRNNISYRQERAEQTSLPNGSVDLITVAQAIHWFDIDNFYNEARRVAKPGALIAAWTYSLLRLSPEVNKVIDHFYNDITRNYWNKERKYIDEQYHSIPFPFEEITTPDFRIVKQYNVEQLIGYLRTWSGVKRYIEQKQKDPIDLIVNDLKIAFGNHEFIEVNWPVHLRAGYIHP